MKYVLASIVVIALLVLSYLVLAHKLPTYLYVGPAGNNPPQQIIASSTKISVTAPRLGDSYEIGKEHEVSWFGYQGTDPLLVVLKETTSDGQVIAKPIAHNIAATTTSILWKVTSEHASSTYNIEVYPIGAREKLGVSQPFSIFGIPLVYDLSIKSSEVLDVSKPVIVTGLVKDSTQFKAVVSYQKGGDLEVISSVTSRCINECRKVYGSYRPFEITLNLTASSACYVIVELYRNKETVPFYSFPLSLKGIPKCP